MEKHLEHVSDEALIEEIIYRAKYNSNFKTKLKTHILYNADLTFN